MLQFQEEYNRERMNYEKRHAALRAHKDLFSVAIELAAHWTSSKLGDRYAGEREANPSFNGGADYANVSVNLWLSKEDDKANVVATLRWLHNRFSFKGQSWRRTSHTPNPSEMYWDYKFTQDRGDEFQNRTWERYRRFYVTFWINQDGLCRKVKVGTEVKTVDIYEWECDEIPA